MWMAQAVDYKIVVPSRHLLHPNSFLKNFQFANDHERQYLKHLAKLASDNKVRIHLLADTNNKTVGLIALSLTTIFGSTCMAVNYLFTSVPYRKTDLVGLGGKKVSEYLIEFAVDSAMEMSLKVPIHFIALQPAHEKLEQFYTLLGFKRLHHKDWMFLRI